MQWPLTSNVSDLSCNPVPKHSAAPSFNSVQQLADGDVSRATWLQEVRPRCLNLNTASATRSQRTSCLTRFRGNGLQQTPYDGKFAVGSDKVTTHKTYVYYRNFTTLYCRLTTPMLQVFVTGHIKISYNFLSVYLMSCAAYSMGPLDGRRPVHREFYLITWSINRQK
jgi:hypothetical protein